MEKNGEEGRSQSSKGVERHIGNKYRDRVKKLDTEIRVEKKENRSNGEYRGVNYQGILNNHKERKQHFQARFQISRTGESE
mmetsp:Transcript_30140/g.28789  ORF Transcript_30140/g.28789 Transcript_30140/m.28789 type:complete len:81 (-) Transcript_30140:875-1117(-)